MCRAASRWKCDVFTYFLIQDPYLYCSSADCSHSLRVYDLFHDQICGIPCSTVASYEQHLLSCHLHIHCEGLLFSLTPRNGILSNISCIAAESLTAS